MCTACITSHMQCLSLLIRLQVKRGDGGLQVSTWYDHICVLDAPLKGLCGEKSGKGIRFSKCFSFIICKVQIITQIRFPCSACRNVVAREVGLERITVLKTSDFMMEASPAPPRQTQEPVILPHLMSVLDEFKI